MNKNFDNIIYMKANLNPWPYYDEETIACTNEVLKSGKVNYWTGEQGTFFEKEFSEWSGSKYSLSVSNGSLALSSIYKALGLRKNDELITTPRSFIATASEALNLGAKVIFADVDENSGNITAETIEPLINKMTKAICVVHLAGWPADMIKICNLARKHNLAVIEDCSQAHGAKINVNGRKVSVGKFGDISAWSFCQDKIISTGGEGGMITTDREDLYKLIWTMRDHGKNKKEKMKQANSLSFNWLHDNKGTNLRLTEIQSAIGRIQLTKINEWNIKRKFNAECFYNKLKELDIVNIPMPSESLNHAWYKFYCYLNNSFFKSGWCRERVIREINYLGYPCFEGGAVRFI